MHRRALRKETSWDNGGLKSLRDDGPPLRLGEGLAGMILLSLALVAGVSVAFVVINHAVLWLVPLALVPTLILGFALHFWLAYVDRLWGWLVRKGGRLQAAFVLFFLYLPTFVALYFLLLAYPMGLALSNYSSPELAADYRRWILDVSAVASMIAWGRLIYRQQ
jgi:hypothetical protein